MIIGQQMTYMCLAGYLYEAVVRTINQDGTVDIGSDVGSADLHEMTRIEIMTAAELRKGTCCEDSGMVAEWRRRAEQSWGPRQLELL